MLAWPGARVQHFFFEGRPVPLARQRSAAIAGRIINFHPKGNVEAKNRIYSAVLKAAPVRFQPPYTIALKFICDPADGACHEYPVSPKHGDLDNLEKLILDALFFTKINIKRPVSVYQDDRHIINCVKFKRMPDAGEVPGIHFWMVKP